MTFAEESFNVRIEEEAALYRWNSPEVARLLGIEPEKVLTAGEIAALAGRAAPEGIVT